MKRLGPNDAAPPFAAPDVFGRAVRLEDYRGGRLLLSFYRYASCPLCNLRMHRLLDRFADWSAGGLAMVAVLESPERQIRRYLDRHQAPFPILPDPQRRLYRAYGVEGSWAAFFRTWTRHLPMVFEAVVREGFLPGRIDGDPAMVPADFLIGPDLRIAEAYYGRHIGDHIPIDRIERFLDSAPGAQPFHPGTPPERIRP